MVSCDVMLYDKSKDIYETEINHKTHCKVRTRRESSTVLYSTVHNSTLPYYPTLNYSTLLASQPYCILLSSPLLYYTILYSSLLHYTILYSPLLCLPSSIILVKAECHLKRAWMLAISWSSRPPYAPSTITLTGAGTCADSG
jgi:hypothetical protein